MTKTARKLNMLGRIKRAREKVDKEISNNASRGGAYARGLANEGWAGGYRQALDDVEAMLIHGFPNDPRHYWSDDK